eukprot:5029534-Pyramimonas_sp.AAC.1
MKLQLIESGDRMQRAVPTVSTAIVVDDLVPQRHGGEHRVSRDIVMAAQVLVNGLSRDSIRIAAKKSQVLASSTTLTQTLKAKLIAIT